VLVLFRDIIDVVVVIVSTIIIIGRRQQRLLGRHHGQLFLNALQFGLGRVALRQDALLLLQNFINFLQVFLALGLVLGHEVFLFEQQLLHALF